MKKYFPAILMMFVTFSLFADFKEPKRGFEVGVDGDFGISNSYLRVEDFLTKNIVVDLEKMADEIGPGGLSMDFVSNFSAYINFQGTNNRLHFFVDTEASGYMNLPKNLFTVLGKGVKVGDDMTMDFHAWSDIFVTGGFSYFHMNDAEDTAFTIMPSYVIPILYVPDIKGRLKYSLSSTGKMEAEFRAPVNVYSALNLEPFMNHDYSMDGLKENLAEVLCNGGFDLSLSYEKKIVRSFDGTVYTRIPVVPGKLKNMASSEYWAYAYELNAMGLLSDSEVHDFDSGKEDFTYSRTNKKVHRPFRLGVEGMWRPFGGWQYFKPMIGFAVRNPYSSDAITYLEAGLISDFSIFGILSFNFATLYLNRVFTQQIGFSINTHLTEFNVYAGLRSGDFSRSFDLSGAAFGVSWKTGL